MSCQSMTDPQATLDRLTAKAGRLYSLPAVAMKVLELTDSPEVDTRALKACIENDPALTTKVLRVVNSSLFGLSREVRDLNQALALLGIKPLKLLVLGFSLPGELFAGVEAEVLGRYWRHTLTKAVAAREISEGFWGLPGDEAFIAGLLQDLGVLVLIQELGEPYVRFLKQVAERGSDPLAQETAALGFEHTRLTARLLSQWGLPGALAEVVCRPPDADPAAAPGGALAEILHLAELAAQLLADGRLDRLGELLETGRRLRDLTQDQLEALVGRLQEKVQQLAEVLSLRLPPGVDCRDLLARAHQQLAEVAAAAAGELLGGAEAAAAPEPDDGQAADQLQALSEAVARVSGGEPERPAAPAAVPRSPPSPAPPDPGLLGHLAAAVAACRQSHSGLSLLLAELDDPENLLLCHGVQGYERLRRMLETACRALDDPCAACVPHGEAGCAVVLPGCERPAAVQLGNQLIRLMGRLSRGACQAAQPAVSVGVATVSIPSKNFPPGDLVAGAQRCLYGSHASGGGVVKSIEMY